MRGADIGVAKRQLPSAGAAGAEAFEGRGGNTVGGAGELAGLGRRRLGGWGNKTHQPVVGTDPRAPVPGNRTGEWGQSEPSPYPPIRRAH